MKPIGTVPLEPRPQSPSFHHGHTSDRATLAAIAHRVMIERGLEPDFPAAARQELAAIHAPAHDPANVRDQTSLLWASIDNDDSRDLDQLSVAEALDGGRIRILVAVADVDALVRKGSALDDHAALNTTSVYTPGAIFRCCLKIYPRI
jgi:exoribonuclease R